MESHEQTVHMEDGEGVEQMIVAGDPPDLGERFGVGRESPMGEDRPLGSTGRSGREQHRRRITGRRVNDGNVHVVRLSVDQLGEGAVLVLAERQTSPLPGCRDDYPVAASSTKASTSRRYRRCSTERTPHLSSNRPTTSDRVRALPDLSDETITGRRPPRSAPTPSSRPFGDLSIALRRPPGR